MQQFQVFIASQGVGYVATLVLLVVAFKMNADTANVALVAAFVVLTGTVFRAPVITEQAIGARILWTCFAVSAASLPLYYWLWTPTAVAQTQSATGPTLLESNFIVGVDEVKVTRVQEDGTVEQPFPPPVPLVQLVVSLRNTGDASIAENFTLGFQVDQNERLIEGDYRAIPPDLEIDDNEPIFQEDDLAEKAFARVETGAAIRGRLLYVFPTIDRQSFDIVGATLVLEFSDASGRRYTTVITRTGAERGFTVRQLPGLRR